MSLIRRRYYTWLLRAYFKRWGRTILSSLVIGAVVFFAVVFLLNFYIMPLMQGKIQKIGYSGAYTTNTIPMPILQDISYGLTQIQSNGKISPGAAYRWQIKNGGRQYIFYIKKGQYFHNGQELTSESLNLGFADVKKENIDNYTVSVTLASPYSPYLANATKPIFAKNFSGLGNFRVKKIELNAGFVKSISLVNKDDESIKKIINFYPTQEALKTAFLLGEIDRASGISNPTIKNSRLSEWDNIIASRNIDYKQLVTLFYNNRDSLLSNKKIRQALNYAIPEKFSDGERAYSPFPPTSIYFSKSPNYGISDVGIARSTIEGEKDIKTATLEISTPQEYKSIADEVGRQWQKLGIKTKIKIVSSIPEKFQILIYPINLPLDPDQYSLWHSDQVNNIIKYKNLRIDKLLEDGRSETDQERRISIYSDFQKYLIDDVPASFLYFPYEYDLIRK